jgi:hypothetical protein
MIFPILLQASQFTLNASQPAVTLRRKIDSPATTRFQFKSTVKGNTSWPGNHNKEYKPESGTSSTTQILTETVMPEGAGQAKIKFSGKTISGQGAVFLDDFTLDDRDRNGTAPMQPKYVDQNGNPANTAGLSFLFKIPITFSYPAKPVSPGDSWSDATGESVLDPQFKVLGIRCIYKGQGILGGLPCYHLVLTEELGDPWDLTSNDLFSGHCTGNGHLEADIYIGQDDGDIQAATITQHTVMDRLDGKNRQVTDKSLEIRRLD